VGSFGTEAYRIEGGSRMHIVQIAGEWYRLKDKRKAGEV
jgi:hypothetical protein